MFNTRDGRRFEEWASEGIARAGRGLIFGVIPGLFHLIMSVFDRLVEWVEKLIYAVDEWLRFREGQSRVVLAIKAVLGMFWGVVAYAARVYLVLLVEPQLNPIKHFPVVTVAAKIMLPFVVQLKNLIAAPLVPFLGTVIADAIAAPTVLFLPGVFGFLVWELRSNWRLYEANRPATLGPLAVGSHGETVVRFLRPAFHSGTLPKRFARLRRALRAGRDRAAAKHREALHHVEEAIRRLVERDFAGLLAREPRRSGLVDRARARSTWRPTASGSSWSPGKATGPASGSTWRNARACWRPGSSGRAGSKAWMPISGACWATRWPGSTRSAGWSGSCRPRSAGGPAAGPATREAAPPGPGQLPGVAIPWRDWVEEWDGEASRVADAEGPAWRAGLLPATVPAPGDGTRDGVPGPGSSIARDDDVDPAEALRSTHREAPNVSRNPRYLRAVRGLDSSYKRSFEREPGRAGTPGLPTRYRLVDEFGSFRRSRPPGAVPNECATKVDSRAQLLVDARGPDGR